MALAMKRAAYQSPRRSANARPIDLLQFEDIPDAAHRMKQLGLECPVDLLSQAVDQDVDRVGTRVEAVVPDVRHDHRLRQDLARMTHKVLEQRELARPKLDGHTGTLDVPGQTIETQVGEGQLRRLLCNLTASRQRLHTGEQFWKRERLGQ